MAVKLNCQSNASSAQPQQAHACNQREVTRSPWHNLDTQLSVRINKRIRVIILSAARSLLRHDLQQGQGKELGSFSSSSSATRSYAGGGCGNQGTFLLLFANGKSTGKNTQGNALLLHAECKQLAAIDSGTCGIRSSLQPIIAPWRQN
jgi:hypothetical protein